MLQDDRVVDLYQLSITMPDAMNADAMRSATERFATDTRAIRSCDDAAGLMVHYKREGTMRGITGTLTTRKQIPLFVLPAQLRLEILSRPIGHASIVFGEGAVRRVLIACTAPAPPLSTQRGQTT